MIVPCQRRIRRLPDELIRVGTSKEAQGRDKTRRGCGVRGDGGAGEGRGGEGGFNVFPIRN